MTLRVKSTQLRERTRAIVLFDDGRTREFTEDWQDTQGGNGYDGGHWGPYCHFRDMVEDKVARAQQLWSLPAATIRYYRESRTTEVLERVTETSSFYSERRAEA